MTGVIRPGSAFLEPGMLVYARPLHPEDLEARRGGFLLNVTETADPDSGELTRTFECIDNAASGTRNGLRRVWLAEADLDLDACYVPQTAQLRKTRRILHQIIGARYRAGSSRNPPTDETELDLERAIGILLGAELR